MIPGTSRNNLKPAAKMAALAIGCACVLVLGAWGVSRVWVFGNEDSAHHQDISDWERADSMAALFDVRWPESARNIYFAKDAWFHYAYEVRVDMGVADAVALLESVPDCEPLSEMPAGFINKDWWQVAGAAEWAGCQTDSTLGWSNSIVVDSSNPADATVYLAHFQPDS